MDEAELEFLSKLQLVLRQHPGLTESAIDKFSHKLVNQLDLLIMSVEEETQRAKIIDDVKSAAILARKKVMRFEKLRRQSKIHTRMYDAQNKMVSGGDRLKKIVEYFDFYIAKMTELRKPLKRQKGRHNNLGYQTGKFVLALYKQYFKGAEAPTTCGGRIIGSKVKGDYLKPTLFDKICDVINKCYGLDINYNCRKEITGRTDK